MSDLREAMAKALYGHQFRADDPVDPVRWDKFRDEYLDQADVVLGVVHEHADIKAAAKAMFPGAEMMGEVTRPELIIAKRTVVAALGGSEKS